MMWIQNDICADCYINPRGCCVHTGQEQGGAAGRERMAYGAL